MNDLLTIDIGHLLRAGNENGSITESELEQAKSKYIQEFERFKTSLGQDDYSLALPFAQAGEIPRIKSLAREIQDKYENILLIGIGGSALGARAIMQYLRGPYYNLTSQPRLFILDNIDPALACRLEGIVDFSKTALIYVSKSGSTAETAANFNYFYRRYREAGGRPEEVVIICDQAENGINRIAHELGCRLLFTPKRLGGRYSVLSCVGFLPAEILGIEAEELLQGAASVRHFIRSESQDDNVLMSLAIELYLLAARGRSVHVMFNYGSLLADFGLWFMQLWGESLGKKVSLTGQVVRAGTTPLHALGTTDQHSLLQLFMEGPQDKVYGFIKVSEPPQDLVVPGEFPEEEYAYFEGHTMNQQLHIQQLATETSLYREGNPCYRVTARDYSALTLGAMFYFYQALTAFSASLWQINPFDQPGVEAGKNITYALMGRRSYANRREQYEAELSRYEQSGLIHGIPSLK